MEFFRRMSTDKDDPGYAAWKSARANGQQIAVLLDGLERTDVITADETKREITRGVIDSSGRILVDHDKGEIVTETLHGEVVIVVSSPPAVVFGA